MPPRAKINKQMILDAAFEIVRRNGAENLNARTIAERLGCSTQPVLYYFKTVEEIKREVYTAADAFHSEYLMKDLSEGNMMKTIGTNYIRFGYEEKHLFRFLMQSGSLSGQMQGLFDDERLMPILNVLAGQLGCGMDQAKKMFSAVWFPAHGIASLLANNSIEYNEAEFRGVMDVIFAGVTGESGGD